MTKIALALLAIISSMELAQAQDAARLKIGTVRCPTLEHAVNGTGDCEHLTRGNLVLIEKRAEIDDQPFACMRLEGEKTCAWGRLIPGHNF